MPVITHVIFDVDDTEQLYRHAHNQVLKEWGISFETSFQRRLMGMRGIEVAEMCVQEYGLPVSAEHLNQLHIDAQLKVLGECQLMPGARPLVEHLAAHRIPIAIATSSHSSSFVIKTANHASLFRHFKAVVLGDDPAVRRGKPAPDIFLEAARRLGAHDRSQCLVLEDSLNGVYAALAAGMHVLWVPDPDYYGPAEQASEIVDNPKVFQISSLHDFDPLHWDLPAFSSIPKTIMKESSLDSE